MTYREAEKEVEKLANGRSFYLEILDYRQRGANITRSFVATIIIAERTASAESDTWQGAIVNLKKDMENI